jgi:paraquat-inducible protein A
MVTFDAFFVRLFPALGKDTAHAVEHNAEWIECPDCGLFQALPRQRGKFDRVCRRCGASFGAGIVAIDVLLALTVAALLVFFAANSAPLLGIFLEGQHNTVMIADATSGLFRQGMFVLSVFVCALSIILPLAHMALQIVVYACLWLHRYPPRLALYYLWAERVRPWAMLDVFLLGMFITISKLRDMAGVQEQILPGMLALGFLIGLFVAASAFIDRQKIWDLISPPPSPGPLAEKRQWIACLHCNLLHEIADEHAPEPWEDLRCDRCHSVIHDRKPYSIQRTWALVIGAFILYIPANLLPVMTVVALGREQPSTIMQGVRQLWTGNDWPYAILVFVASIVIPLIKLLGLTGMLLTYHTGNRNYLMHCARAYRIFDKIGRWSVLDIFVAATLGALVDFDNLATVVPGSGLMPFAGVVVLTVLAVAAFDPRLMWDAAMPRKDKQHE